MVTIVMLVICAFALLLAAGARLRLWYYNRRNCLQYAEEEAAHARRDGLRHQCSQLWWEGQR